MGADAVFDFVGADDTLAPAIGIARSGGHVSIVGLAGGGIPIGYRAMPFETTLVMPYAGTRAELIEVLGLAWVQQSFDTALRRGIADGSIKQLVPSLSRSARTSPT